MVQKASEDGLVGDMYMHMDIMETHAVSLHGLALHVLSEDGFELTHQDIVPCALHVAILHVGPCRVLGVMNVASGLPHSAVALEAGAKAHLQANPSKSASPHWSASGIAAPGGEVSLHSSILPSESMMRAANAHKVHDPQ